MHIGSLIEWHFGKTIVLVLMVVFTFRGHINAHCTGSLLFIIIKQELVVGRVPGDYPVLAGYCTTRHYPDPTGYYVKMWQNPSNLSNSIS